MLALTAREAQILAAVADRIFPPTDTPGAVEAGAVTYVDRALAQAYRPLLPRYRRGLRDLDRYAEKTAGRPFPALGEGEQDALLADLEAGRVPGGAEFFQLVRQHVLEGVFCEPEYGGNRDLQGWRVVGFPGQQHGYADPHINRPVDIPPFAGTPFLPSPLKGKDKGGGAGQ